MFAQTNIEFSFYSYYDVNEFYSTIHLEWNLLLFVGVGGKMTSLHITWTTEKFMSSLHITVSF